VVDRHLIESRLAAIRDHVTRVREMLSPRRELFLTDRGAQEAVAFNLFLAFQDALDLAAHVIADRSLALPTSGREHFEILARAGLLSVPAAEAMARCAGLRNLIAHAYGSLDLGRLYDETPAGLAALQAFSQEVEAAR
jgi:uncharacterized protein YutE (UPF0331/DUF86 family)